MRLHPISAALLAAFSGPLLAQESTGMVDSTAMTLGEVVVTASGGPLEPSKVLTSVDIVTAERVENQVVSNNWELFDQVPGVMLTRFGQGTTSGKFSMRGFNGEGEINAVKLLIDGIPSNSNDGNMPYIDLAPQLDIESIEVVKGTNDPRYGLHNIAGNANISTRMGGNYAQARATLGSFDTRGLQAAAGYESNGISQNYAIGYLATDGYRDHSEAENIALSGKWFVTPAGGNSRIGVIARHYQGNAEEAGYLTASQVAADPSQSLPHNAFDEDSRKVSQLAIQAESDFSEQLYGTAQIYLNDLYDRRYVRFSAAASQQERFTDETHVGASGSLKWRIGKTSIGDVTLTGGLDTERQDNKSERYTTVAQVRTAQTRDQQFDFNTVGGFVQAVIKPTDKLTVTPAFRVDQVSGEYTNLLNGNTYDANDYGLIKQPKLSAIYSFSRELAVYGNWGRSFQVGVGTAAYKVNQSEDLEPSINEGWEAGLKFRPLSWLDGRLAIWQQTANNEARRKLNDPSNDSENIGKTLREGIDLEINARPSSKLNFWLATAVQRSEILRADSASQATEGKEIDHVPHLLYNLGVDYKMNDAWSLSAWANGQSSYYLERTNSTGKFGDYTLLNASVKYAYSPSLNFELQLRNLADQYYEYVWWDGSQSLHSPGVPRSIYASVNMSF